MFLFFYNNRLWKCYWKAHSDLKPLLKRHQNVNFWHFWSKFGLYFIPILPLWNSFLGFLFKWTISCTWTSKNQRIKTVTAVNVWTHKQCIKLILRWTYNMTHIIWAIWYGSYNMIHIQCNLLVDVKNVFEENKIRVFENGKSSILRIWV